MQYDELIDTLQNLTECKPTQQELASVLQIAQPTLAGKISRKSLIKQSDIDLLEKHYKVKLVRKVETLTLDYIHINPSCGHGTYVLDEPDVTPVKLGVKMIQEVLQVQNPNVLKVICASGDSMAPTINDKDLCIIDTSRTDYMNGGVFLLTINNNWYVKRIRKRITGELDIISDNPRYEIETFNPNTDIDIYIKGRVIHNLSSLL